MLNKNDNEIVKTFLEILQSDELITNYGLLIRDYFINKKVKEMSEEINK